MNEYELEIGKHYYFETIRKYWTGAPVARSLTHAIIDDAASDRQNRPVCRSHENGIFRRVEPIPSGPDPDLVARAAVSTGRIRYHAMSCMDARRDQRRVCDRSGAITCLRNLIASFGLYSRARTRLGSLEPTWARPVLGLGLGAGSDLTGARTWARTRTRLGLGRGLGPGRTRFDSIPGSYLGSSSTRARTRTRARARTRARTRASRGKTTITTKTRTHNRAAAMCGRLSTRRCRSPNADLIQRTRIFLSVPHGASLGSTATPRSGTLRIRRIACAGINEPRQLNAIETF
jgi:hypothetical protein